jgi:hypothetical protein
MLIRLLPVAEKVSDVDEGQGDAEPHSAHAEHGSEWDSAARVLAPDEEIDEDAHSKDQAGVQGSRQESRGL